MIMANAYHPRRVPLGRIVATPGALAALERSGDSAYAFFARHMSGDWGDVCEEDRRANELALVTDARLMSVYCTRLGDTLWLITEADRSSSCLLCPDEY